MNRAPGAPAVIEVRVDDLGFFEGEAIVRPVNDLLRATTPLMRRLELAAGAAFLESARLSEPLPVGAAVVTGAGDLGVELLIHGVVSSDMEPVSRATVRMALASALHRVDAFQVRNVAIAPFGLGAGNLDIEESADVMCDVITVHMRRSSYPASVVIIAETTHEEQALRDRLARFA
ncbi:MAG: macro domain-containing protein [Gemmatimonadaceae bacterium]